MFLELSKTIDSMKNKISETETEVNSKDSLLNQFKRENSQLNIDLKKSEARLKQLSSSVDENTTVVQGLQQKVSHLQLVSYSASLYSTLASKAKSSISKY